MLLLVPPLLDHYESAAIDSPFLLLEANPSRSIQLFVLALSDVMLFDDSASAHGIAMSFANACHF